METRKKVLILIGVLVLIGILPLAWVVFKNKESKTVKFNQTTNKEMTKEINANDEKNVKGEQEAAAKDNQEEASAEEEISVFDGVIIKKDVNLVTVEENNSKEKKTFAVGPETVITEVEMKAIPASGEYEKKEKGKLGLNDLKEMDGVSVIYEKGSKTSDGSYKAESIKKFVVIE